MANSVSKKFYVIFKVYIFLVVLYFLGRVAYLAFNWGSLGSYGAISLFEAFLHGLRFDIVAITLTNAPILVWALLATRRKFFHPWSELVQKLYLFLVNTFFVTVNLVDAVLVGYTGKRMTKEIFLLSQDILTEFVDAAIDYWYMFGFTFIIWWGIWKLLGRFYKSSKDEETWFEPIRSRWVFGSAQSLIYFVLFIFASRGGFQLKPIKVVNAFVLQSVDLATLALNTPFTIIKSGKLANLADFAYISDSEQEKVIQEWKREISAPSSIAPINEVSNIVFIVLESFALEYTGLGNSYKGYTPFLDELSKKSLTLVNSFANGRRSIEAIPSILCGVPSLMQEGFITSSYQSNKISCLPEKLKAHNFTSMFFHGAKNGTMYFDSFGQRIGFDQYYGLSEYPNKEHFDGTWGIYDGHFLKFFADTLSNAQQPFLGLLFTLSSHHPYKIPDEYKGQFSLGTLEIHESIGYTDQMLREFFERAKTKTWFKNTLFILTADHTQKSDQKEYADILGRYRVPILFYHSNANVVNALKLKASSGVFQHIDLMPSVLDVLGIEDQSPSFFGRSIFRSASGSREVYNGDDHYFWWSDGESVVSLDGLGKMTQTSYAQWSENGPVAPKAPEILGVSRVGEMGTELTMRAQSVRQIFNYKMKKDELILNN